MVNNLYHQSALRIELTDWLKFNAILAGSRSLWERDSFAIHRSTSSFVKRSCQYLRAELSD